MTRRRGLLAAVVGVALAIVVVIGALLLAPRASSPEDAASAYLRALEAGDVGVVAAAAPGIPDDALTAFASATGRIEDSVVGEVVRDGDTATAEVSFSLSGQERTVALSLARIDGAWRVDADALGTLDVVAAPARAVTIGEATLTIGDSVTLLPGEYRVDAAPADLLDGVGTATILPGATTALALDTGLRPAATSAAQDALDAHLRACTSRGGPETEECGIRLPWGTEFRAVDDVAYRIEALPVIALDGLGFTADGGVLVATVTGTGQDGSARTTTYRTDSWSIRGDVAFTATGVTVMAW